MCTYNYASQIVLYKLYYTLYLDNNPLRVNITIENSYSLHIKTAGCTRQPMNSATSVQSRYLYKHTHIVKGITYYNKHRSKYKV